MKKFYIARMVTVNHIRFEARSKEEAKRRAETMFKQIEKNVPVSHKREFYIDEIYGDD